MAIAEPDEIITPSTPFFRGLFSINDQCFRLRDLVKTTLHRINPVHRQLTKRNRALKGVHAGERCFILGTSPSIGQQDLSGLVNETTFAVNFFHKHPMASQIQPDYWLIQDKKLWQGGWPQDLVGAEGVWPDTMLDDIVRASPHTRLFLPVDGAEESSMRRATANKQVYWLANGKGWVHGFRGPVDMAGAGLAGNVMQIAVGLADYLGFTEINLLGISMDGLLRDLGGTPSHFYSAPPDNRHMEYTTIERDLIMSGFGFRSWRALAQYYSRTGIRIRNLTPDGYLSIFPRLSLEEALAEPRLE